MTPRVLDKVGDLVLLVLLVPIIMCQEDKKPIIEIMIMLKIMEGILENNSKVTSIESFTYEDDFTYYIQDEDHDFRRVGIRI